MHYVMSDLHGCYTEYKKMLEKIHFSDQDELYILGDVTDRGPNPVEIVKDMAARYNVIPLIGNHEYVLLRVMPSLFREIEEETIESTLTMDFMRGYQLWMSDGGHITLNGFKEMSEDDREFYLDYIRDYSLYEELIVGGRHYFLIHTLPADFHETGELKGTVEEILFSRPNFHADWDQETIYIIGHTPTFKIGEEYAGKIYRKGNLIDIDCGCAAGYRLGAYCLETDEEFYVDYEEPLE